MNLEARRQLRNLLAVIFVLSAVANTVQTARHSVGAWSIVSLIAGGLLVLADQSYRDALCREATGDDQAQP